MSKKLFLDESGECSFSESSNFTHFLIAIVSIDSNKAKMIKSKLKREFAQIINCGWNKNEEIKASRLYNNKKFGEKPIINVINSILGMESIQFHYLVVNKHKITTQSFRNAPYGIGYNYFTGVLLSELIFQEGYHHVNLTYDLRNKETHQKRHFKEYLETKIYGASLEHETPVKIEIEGFASDQSYGLMAVDFISWSIFRKFEHGDNRFFDLITERLRRRIEWYI